MEHQLNITNPANDWNWGWTDGKPAIAQPTTSPQTIISARHRNRASIACTACRSTRTKCFVDTGQNQCDRCRRQGIECIIRDDDGRRKQTSKVQANALLARIQLLENKLKQENQKSELDQLATPTQTAERSLEAYKFSSPVLPISSQRCINPKTELRSLSSSAGHLVTTDSDNERIIRSAPSYNVVTKRNSTPEYTRRSCIVNNIHFLYGYIHTSTSIGNLRSFGPTTNMHLRFKPHQGPSVTRNESHWRIEMVLPDIASRTLEYLMDLYWTCHNSTIHLIHKDAFYEDEISGKNQFYSTFLHFAMLSIGYRYADKSRADIKQVALPGHESTLHKRVIKLVEHEMQSPGGIASVQALFLLGDLECGCGRDDTGWMYAGMSLRLAFDIGLHLETTGSDLKDRDIQIRYMVMWACIINDKYWSLFLGRPTSVKRESLSIVTSKKDFNRLLSCRSVTLQKPMETKVYEALLDLMDIAGQITDILGSQNISSDNDAYFRMAALDKSLHKWYNNLSCDLKWTTKNVATAPFSFHLLHQQYHTACILLHRPFADYESVRPVHDSDQLVDHITPISAFSRQMCSHHATRTARIFKEHRQRFDTRRIFVTAIQHAGTAATALIAEIAIAEGAEERLEPLKHLMYISSALSSMSETYQPAEEMSSIIDEFFKDYKHEWSIAQQSASSDAIRCNSQDGKSKSWTVPHTGAKKRPYHAIVEEIDLTKIPDPDGKGGGNREEQEALQLNNEDYPWDADNYDLENCLTYKELFDGFEYSPDVPLDHDSLEFINGFNITN